MKDFREMKRRGERITALTAYDYPTARLLDESGIDIILVGDSLGMVVLGYQDIVPSPVADVLGHVAVGEHGVAGDHLALDRQHPQQPQGRLVLVGLGVDAELGQDRLDLRGVGGHQVDPGRRAVAAPPRRVQPDILRTVATALS